MIKTLHYCSEVWRQKKIKKKKLLDNYTTISKEKNQLKVDQPKVI